MPCNASTIREMRKTQTEPTQDRLFCAEEGDAHPGVFFKGGNRAPGQNINVCCNCSTKAARFLTIAESPCSLWSTISNATRFVCDDWTEVDSMTQSLYVVHVNLPIKTDGGRGEGGKFHVILVARVLCVCATVWFKIMAGFEPQAYPRLQCFLVVCSSSSAGGRVSDLSCNESLMLAMVFAAARCKSSAKGHAAGFGRSASLSRGPPSLPGGPSSAVPALRTWRHAARGMAVDRAWLMAEGPLHRGGRLWTSPPVFGPPLGAPLRLLAPLFRYFLWAPC